MEPFALIDSEDDYRLVGDDVLLAWFTDATSWLSLLRLLVTNKPAEMTTYPEDSQAETFKVILAEDIPERGMSFKQPYGPSSPH